MNDAQPLEDDESRFEIGGIEDVKAVNFNRVCSCNEPEEACSDCDKTPQLELTRPDRRSIVIELDEQDVENIKEAFQVLDYPYK